MNDLNKLCDQVLDLVRDDRLSEKAAYTTLRMWFGEVAFFYSNLRGNLSILRTLAFESDAATELAGKVLRNLIMAACDSIEAETAVKSYAG